MNALIIFSLGILFGSLTIRIDSIVERTGLVGTSQAWNNLLIITTLASGIAMFALMTWGFVEYQWWIPVLVFLASGIISAIIVNGRTFVFFALARPLFSLFSIIVAVWCWMI